MNRTVLSATCDHDPEVTKALGISIARPEGRLLVTRYSPYKDQRRQVFIDAIGEEKLNT